MFTRIDFSCPYLLSAVDIDFLSAHKHTELKLDLVADSGNIEHLRKPELCLSAVGSILHHACFLFTCFTRSVLERLCVYVPYQTVGPVGWFRCKRWTSVNDLIYLIVSFLV